METLQFCSIQTIQITVNMRLNDAASGEKSVFFCYGSRVVKVQNNRLKALRVLNHFFQKKIRAENNVRDFWEKKTMKNCW